MKSGHFVWHDLYSTAPDACKTFYAELLGWSIEDQDMGSGPYATASVNDVRLGGINPLTPNLTESTWYSYISVNDIATAVDSITNAGGTIDGPAFAVPGIGQMAYVRDPWGAAFSPFQDENPDYEPELPSGNPAPGSPAWHELLTPDADGAIAFYRDLTGWDHVAWDMGEAMYHGLTIGDVPMAGLYQCTDDQTPGWTIYFAPNGSLTDAIAAIPRLGGKLIGDRITVPGTGEFQLAKDPSGATFGLLESEAME